MTPDEVTTKHSEVITQTNEKFGVAVCQEWINQSRLAALTLLANKYHIPIDEVLEEQYKIHAKTLADRLSINPDGFSREEQKKAEEILIKGNQIAGLVIL